MTKLHTADASPQTAKQAKRWCLLTLGLALGILLLCAGATALIDPFFHYHPPLDGLQYPIDNQRYQNDGILRSFSYDALITGTSMTENFRASEFDALFGVSSVKVSLSGGTLEELGQELRRALTSNPRCSLVLLGLDAWHVLPDRSLIQADGDYPAYLYDDNPFNDISYLLNKEILVDHTLRVLDYTRQGGRTTGFDSYGRWSEAYTYSPQAVLDTYSRDDDLGRQAPYTDEQRQALEKSLEDTLLSLAREHPDVTFLCFFTPHSVLKWDRLLRTGRFDQQMEAYRQASELLLSQENVRLYSFFSDFTLTTDLNHYKDISHYSGEINALLLKKIAAEEGRLTSQSSRSHWDSVDAFFRNYDYDALFSGQS